MLVKKTNGNLPEKKYQFLHEVSLIDLLYIPRKPTLERTEHWHLAIYPYQFSSTKI
jgi:hypothetical protein